MNRKRLFSSLFVVVLAFLAVLSPVNAAPSFSHTLTNNLYSYWPLDEASGNRSDSHGFNELLTDVGSVSSAAGKVSNAASFSGTNYLSRVSTGTDSLAVVCGVTNGCTFSAWVYLTDKTATRPIIAKAASGSLQYSLVYRLATDHFSFALSPDGTTNVVVDSSVSPSVSTWYFVVAWYDPVADTISIQVNNGTPASTSFTGFPVNNTSDFRIGSRQSDSAVMVGRVDEVGIWNTVLTSTERGYLYNSDNGCTYDFVSCEPTHTPTQTPTFTNTPLPTSTFTNTPLPTDTSTNTPVPTSTFTNTPLPTDTPTNTPVPTSTFTNTPVFTDTPTNTPLPTNTPTNTPLPTSTPTNTEAPTATPTPFTLIHLPLILA
jgi:hypothetical protein